MFGVSWSGLPVTPCCFVAPLPGRTLKLCGDGPSFLTLNVTAPAGTEALSRAIAKSFSVAAIVVAGPPLPAAALPAPACVFPPPATVVPDAADPATVVPCAGEAALLDDDAPVDGLLIACNKIETTRNAK